MRFRCVSAPTTVAPVFLFSEKISTRIRVRPEFDKALSHEDRERRTRTAGDVLTGIYNPRGMGAMLFAVLAVVVQLDRNYIREKTLEGQQAAAKDNHGGRPKVFDDDMVICARALRNAGTPVPDIAKKLVIRSVKNAGRHPSVASVYRVPGESGRTAA